VGYTQEKTQKEGKVYRCRLNINSNRHKKQSKRRLELAVITRHEIENKAEREILVEKRLNDMGFDEREHGPELRVAAKQYYMGLIEEDLANGNDVLFNESLDSAEGLTLGFVAGYEACLRNNS